MNRPKPEVMTATVSSADGDRDTARASGPPSSASSAPKPERDRPDEPDLHRPEQVLEAAPEEADDGRRGRARAAGQVTASGEDEDLQHDDRVERQQDARGTGM